MTEKLLKPTRNVLLSFAGALAASCSGPEPGDGAGSATQPTEVAAAEASGAGQGGGPAGPPGTELPPVAFGDPVPGLTAEELARFEEGRADFQEVETPEDGLGPVFNDVSCAACHSVPAIGGASGIGETRFGTPTGDPLAARGGPLIQVNGIGVVGDCDYAGETVPAQAIASGRRTTPLFGLGLVDALTAGALQALAADQRARSPEEAGRVAMVRDVATGGTAVGKFGWKSQVPTLHQFAGDAYLNEMGITSPDFPNENCPSGDCALLRCNPFPEVNDDGSGVTLFADFMTFLAPPARGAIDAAVTAGEAVFEEIGCARCHTPTLVTGGGSPAAALRFVAFHPFSDFLLHDMGSLGDGIQTGDAGGSEFRTAPLWGLRTTSTYLHDGRAGTLRDAIEAHDGQGSRAREAFRALSAADQDALMRFLGSL